MINNVRSNPLVWVLAAAAVLAPCFLLFVCGIALVAAGPSASPRSVRVATIAPMERSEAPDLPPAISAPISEPAPSATPELTETPWPTETPEPTATATTIPTATPTPCNCGANVYNCDDFSSPSAAQQCYLQCQAAGAGDVHDLDRDGDGRACEWDN